MQLQRSQSYEVKVRLTFFRIRTHANRFRTPTGFKNGNSRISPPHVSSAPPKPRPPLHSAKLSSTNASELTSYHYQKRRSYVLTTQHRSIKDANYPTPANQFHGYLMRSFQFFTREGPRILFLNNLAK